MIYLYHGEDTYDSYHLAKAKANKIADATGKELLILDADETSAEELSKHLQNINLFSSGSVILAKRLLLNPELNRYLTEAFEQLNKSYDLVIWHEGKADQRVGLVKKIKQKAQTFISSPAREMELQRWVMQQGETRGLNLSPSLVTQILEQTGQDKWLIEKELEKLQLYLDEKRSALTSEVISLVLGTETSGDIWQFLDALSMGKRTAALRELAKLLEFDDNAQYLLGMLARELNLIAQVLYIQSRGLNSNTLGLHPFVLKKTMKKAANFTWNKVQKLSHALVRLDLAIKQGKISPEEGLLVYALSW